MTNQEILTWLNGRTDKIKIYDNKGRKIIIWSPDLNISIEQAILNYINKNKINWKKEIQ
jgi:hypothetical protein